MNSKNLFNRKKMTETWVNREVAVFTYYYTFMLKVKIIRKLSMYFV